MNASFDGFSVGQRLQLPEIDENVGFKVTDIFPGGMGVCLRVENEQTHGKSGNTSHRMRHFGSGKTLKNKTLAGQQHFWKN